MNVLDQIFERKRAVAAARQGELADWKAAALDAPAVRPFRGALESSLHRPSLIAEVKKASPVKGVIRADFDPASIAEAYREAGVDCLSVLTDVEGFQGDPSYLALCREVSGKPVLRKDFTCCELDIHEARTLHADAVLLIVYGLSDDQLKLYREVAESLGMSVIVEVHDEHELERAVTTGARIIGVNNRDLRTFETRIDTSERLIPRIPTQCLAISESALGTPADIQRVHSAGARSVLIGTSFCKAPDVAGKVREVMGW